jgi:hypothetical protein
VIVPIKDFSEWYFHHPIVESLMTTNSTALLYEYGLWGCCGKCCYRYERTVLYLLPAVQDADSHKVSFMAKSDKSAGDFRALQSGKCPSCGHDKMICIITDIPGYVREAIKTKKERRLKEA